MSLYQLRDGDIGLVLSMLQTANKPLEVAQRIIDNSPAANADLLRAYLQDYIDDADGIASSGQGIQAAAILRVADAIQGIEDQPSASISYSSDADGSMLIVERSGDVAAIP